MTRWHNPETTHVIKEGTVVGRRAGGLFNEKDIENREWLSQYQTAEPELVAACMDEADDALQAQKSTWKNQVVAEVLSPGWNILHYGYIN